MLGCDFNDISYPQKKRGESARSEASSKGFREFIRNMNMWELTCQGKDWTWAIIGMRKDTLKLD